MSNSVLYHTILLYYWLTQQRIIIFIFIVSSIYVDLIHLALDLLKVFFLQKIWVPIFFLQKILIVLLRYFKEVCFGVLQLKTSGSTNLSQISWTTILLHNVQKQSYRFHNSCSVCNFVWQFWNVTLREKCHFLRTNILLI